jgi:hypothetical protein
MKQTSIIIGICGQSESGKKTLFEVLQHSRNPDICSNNGRVIFKIFRQDDSCSLKEQELSLVSCSAYLYVIDCERLDELDTSLLEVLINRDRDLFNQHRALLVINKLDSLFRFTHIYATHHSSFTPSSSCSGSSVSEYSLHSRLLDREDLEMNVKEKVNQTFLVNLGVDLSFCSIYPSILQWALVARRHVQGIENTRMTVSQMKSWVTLHEPFGQVADKNDKSDDVNTLENISGIIEIESWLSHHIKKKVELNELSLLSDVIHCVNYCADKLQNDIEIVLLRIESLEFVKIQKNQLIMECNSLYREFSTRGRDAMLLTELMQAYSDDIKSVLVKIDKLADDIVKTFKQKSTEKCKRLIESNWEYSSFESLMEEFELDIDSYCRGAAKQLIQLLRSVEFLKMHNTMPFKHMKEAFYDLMKLTDHLLQEQISLVDNEKPQYGIVRARTVLSGFELHQPISFIAISHETDNMPVLARRFRQYFYSLLHHCTSSIIPNHHPTTKEECFSQTHSEEAFKLYCKQFLLSGELQRKAAQFHMDIVCNYISNHLKEFDLKYRTKIDSMMNKIEDDINSLTISKNNIEKQFKEIANLKVDLEIRKACLLADY